MKNVIVLLFLLFTFAIKSQNVICNDSVCIEYISKIINNTAYINWVITTKTNSIIVLERSYNGKNFKPVLYKNNPKEILPIPLLFGFQDNIFNYDKVWYRVRVVEIGGFNEIIFPSEVVTKKYKISNYNE